VAKKDRSKDQAIVATLNSILEFELAGVVRYTHYSLMVFGHGRLPIVAWMRQQATESLAHAVAAGEHITTLGGHPSLRIGALLETHRHDIDDILRESLAHEQAALSDYRRLLDLVRDRSVVLEEYARRMLHDEEIHVSEVEKMLRQPGQIDRQR
jgi:bacterioferritin